VRHACLRSCAAAFGTWELVALTVPLFSRRPCPCLSAIHIVSPGSQGAESPRGIDTGLGVGKFRTCTRFDAGGRVGVARASCLGAKKTHLPTSDALFAVTDGASASCRRRELAWPDGLSFLAMDVSFISATLVLPSVVQALAPPRQSWRGEAVILVKPQFEAGREYVGKGGIVRDQAGRELAIERVRECVVALGGREVDVIDSPITGAEGNREYLLHTSFEPEPVH